MKKQERKMKNIIITAAFALALGVSTISYLLLSALLL